MSNAPAITWIQPAPAKAYGVFYRGKWWGEGDTPEQAWADAERTIRPASPKLWGTFAAFGRDRLVQATTA